MLATSAPCHGATQPRLSLLSRVTGKLRDGRRAVPRTDGSLALRSSARPVRDFGSGSLAASMPTRFLT